MFIQGYNLHITLYHWFILQFIFELSSLDSEKTTLKHKIDLANQMAHFS